MAKANSLYKKDEEIIIHSKIENVLVADEVVNEENKVESSSSETKVNNDDIYEGIKKIFNENQKVERDSIYFIMSKDCKFKYNIDNTIFSPNKLSLLQPRKFEEVYLQQLESYIFTSKEEIDTSKLFAIIYLFSHLNKNNYPVRIVTSNYIKLLPKVCKILNTFFNKNYNVIYSIYTMFNSIKDTEEEQNG